MPSHLSHKKRLLIGVPVVLITAGILVACWILFPQKVFLVVLISLAILGMIAEYFLKRYERRKTSHAGKGATNQ
jgi:CHASE2 domain-containing sensor protein